MPTIPHIIIKGKPFERGLSYGRQLGHKMKANLDYYKKSFPHLDWVKVHEFVNNTYMKAIEKYYPNGLLEMRGMAAGAEMMIEDIIALNSIYELRLWDRNVMKNKAGNVEKVPLECTSAACLSEATQSGDVLLGMNWDANEYFYRENMTVLLEVHPDPHENIAPFFMFAEVGGMGRIGMNANGLGITGLSLYSSDDHFDEGKAGFMPITLLRRLFIEAPNFPVALKRLLWAPRHVSNNIMVATSESEAINIEMTPNEFFITYPSLETHFLSHTNRFKSEGFVAKSSLKDTVLGFDMIRDRQMQMTLYSRCKSGTVTYDYFVKAFANHVGFPNSMCLHKPPDGRHEDSCVPLNYMTIANIIMNLTTKTIRVCSGQPCGGSASEYTLN